MWDSLKRWLDGLIGPRAGSAQDLEDARLCAAALLVEAALADGIYASVEEERIRVILCETFSISGEACDRLLEEAESRAEAAADAAAFAHAARRLPQPERERLLECLWRVVFADGEESPFEEAFIRRVASQLAIAEEPARAARQRAKDRMQPP